MQSTVRQKILSVYYERYIRKIVVGLEHTVGPGSKERGALKGWVRTSVSTGILEATSPSLFSAVKTSAEYLILGVKVSTATKCD